LKRFGNKWSWPIWGTIPIFVYKDWRKPRTRVQQQVSWPRFEPRTYRRLIRNIGFTVTFPFFSMALQPSGPWPLFQFLNLYIVGLLDGGSARHKAATYTQNKLSETSMSWVGFEPTVPVFARPGRSAFTVTYWVIIKLWRKDRSGDDRKGELKENEARSIGRKKLFFWRTCVFFYSSFLCSFYEFQFVNTC
jgi:hypothetical protein